MTSKTKGIWVSADLHKRLKIRASEKGISIKELVNGYLVDYFKEQELNKEKTKQTKIRDN